MSACSHKSVPWGFSGALALDLEPTEGLGPHLYPFSLSISVGQILLVLSLISIRSMMSQRLMICRERIPKGLRALTTNNKKPFEGYLLCFKYQIGCIVKLIKFLPKINEGLPEGGAVTVSILKTRSLRLRRGEESIESHPASGWGRM